MRWELSEEGKGRRDHFHSKGESEEAGLRHRSASGVCAHGQLKPANYSLHTHHFCRQEICICCVRARRDRWEAEARDLFCVYTGQLPWRKRGLLFWRSVVTLLTTVRQTCFSVSNGVLLEQYQCWNSMSLPHQCARWAVSWCLEGLNLHAAWLRSSQQELSHSVWHG